MSLNPYNVPPEQLVINAHEEFQFVKNELKSSPIPLCDYIAQFITSFAVEEAITVEGEMQDLRSFSDCIYSEISDLVDEYETSVASRLTSGEIEQNVFTLDSLVTTTYIFILNGLLTRLAALRALLKQYREVGYTYHFDRTTYPYFILRRELVND